MDELGRKKNEKCAKVSFSRLVRDRRATLFLFRRSVYLDELSLKSKQPIATTPALLLQLELKGGIRSIEGNKFERC